MIEMNKCIYVYIVFDLVVDEESTEVAKLKIEILEVFLNVFVGFVPKNRGNSGQFF